MGQSANMAHFVAFFIIFQDIVTLKLLSIVKNLWFLPQNEPQNAHTVFKSSVMNIYDMYYEKMHYNI
jgi:hypothetical protein